MYLSPPICFYNLFFVGKITMSDAQDALDRLNARIAYMESDKFPALEFDGRVLEDLKCVRVVLIGFMGKSERKPPGPNRSQRKLIKKKRYVKK